RKMKWATSFFQLPRFVEKAHPMITCLRKFLPFRHLNSSAQSHQQFALMEKITGQVPCSQPTEESGNTMKSSRNTCAQPDRWQSIWKQPLFLLSVLQMKSL